MLIVFVFGGAEQGESFGGSDCRSTCLTERIVIIDNDEVGIVWD